MTLEVVILDQMNFDGPGVPGSVGDVGIEEDRIDAVGGQLGWARRVFEADGLAVALGFIVTHTPWLRRSSGAPPSRACATTA